MTKQAWRTAAEVLQAKADLEAAMPGWQAPVAYALGVETSSGIEWRVTNYPATHALPAVVLGTVLGHRSGSATYYLDIETFDRAIELLEPAGACDEFDHPNLWAWQKLRPELRDSDRVVVVFIGDGDGGDEDDVARRLRAELGA